MNSEGKQMTVDDIATSKGNVLKLKSYIQPFEKYLAQAELYGLLGQDLIESPLSQPASSKIFFSAPIPVEFLRRRLAYWEQVGEWLLKPTLQVMLESDKGIDAFNKNAHRLHKSRKLRYGPHGIHEYRGKFFPQLVRSLINFAGLSAGNVVLDPMCGSGTTNCEARSMGMKTLGVDLNRLSIEISKLKSSLFDVDLQMFEKNVRKTIVLIENARHYKSKANIPWGKRDLDYLKRWFSPIALDEIAIIWDIVKACPQDMVRQFLTICLSNIIRPVSWQKDTDLRVRKEIKDYRNGTAFTLLLEVIQKNLTKIISYLSCFEKDYKFDEFTIKEGDSRQINKFLPEWVGKCDLLITSPPYAMALPYIDTDRLSLVVLNMLPRSKHSSRETTMIGNREITEKQRKTLWETYLCRCEELPISVRKLIDQIATVNHTDKVGFRRRNLPALLARYFLDMTEAMRSARKMMKPGCYAFYVVGNNSTNVNGKRIDIMTDQFLWEIGKKVGWKQKKVINMELLPSRDIFRNNRGTAESILWLEA